MYGVLVLALIYTLSEYSYISDINHKLLAINEKKTEVYRNSLNIERRLAEMYDACSTGDAEYGYLEKFDEYKSWARESDEIMVDVNSMQAEINK